jgi:hypothetical protein
MGKLEQIESKIPTFKKLEAKHKSTLLTKNANQFDITTHRQ